MRHTDRHTKVANTGKRGGGMTKSIRKFMSKELSLKSGTILREQKDRNVLFENM